ncbi:hypothetical protein C0991_005303 [Blastosporella zonata]|nr:hypothetical protein C0991_005303 [Blastosporella zonata]
MESGNESPPPPPRSTNILGSFLRGRPRNSSQSHIITPDIRELSPSPPQPPSPGGMTAVVNGHRRSRAGLAGAAVQGSASNQATTTTTPIPTTTTLSHMLRRRRSAGTIATPAPQLPAPLPPVPTPAPATTPIPSTSAPNPPISPNPNVPSSAPPGATHRIRLVPHLDSRRTLRFEAITRDIAATNPPLRIGRFTDRSGLGLAAVNALGTNRLAFKSKVVSRAHAEIWVENGGRFFIKDTKSSSGTFLNHVRLSPANTESRPYQMKDGDILQLGVDYQGGAEDIYKSVKIRIEIGREWQAGVNAFNTNTLKILKTLQVPAPSKSASGSGSAKSPIAPVPSAKHQIPDCCICLFGVTIRQALFIAPCSHTFHYKCIRPLLESHHPAFSCPLCRTFADLEEDVEIEPEEDVDGAGVNGEEDDESVGLPEEATPAPPDVLPSVRGVVTHEDVVLEEEEEGEGDEEGDEMHGVESEGSGSGEGAGRGDSPALVIVNELGEMGGHAMDVDATVGVGVKARHVIVTPAS